MAARKHLEDDESMALIRWRDLHAKRYPELGLLIAIPNGGKRNAREAARLKRMGVRAGVSDYLLPVFRNGNVALNASHIHFPAWRSGIWIELKAGKNKATPEQLEWLRLVQEQGYAGIVCTGWMAAARAICDYLGLTGSVRP